MATTTPNYGWTVPTSTDLVKDGATAIETLGDAIDASMNTALGTKKAGMVLLNTTNFTGVSSQALPANTFSATYTNYRILFNVTASAASLGILKMRMRAAGVDASGSDYFFSMNGLRVTNASNTRADNGATSGGIAFGSVGARVSVAFDVFTPNTTDLTRVSGTYTGDDGTATNNGSFGGFHGQGVAYDSINFIPDTSNMTGTVTVYGYQK